MKKTYTGKFLSESYCRIEGRDRDNPVIYDFIVVLPI